eukprot:scaffold968_cov231-Chaetoceros_neogracile.AAC.7
MEDAVGAFQSPFTIPEGTKKRELKRDTSLLREFDASESQDLLVLYHHVRDAAFDCFNAAEYTSQMLRYYQNGWSLVVVAPRTIIIKDQDRVREHCQRAGWTEHKKLCKVAKSNNVVVEEGLCIDA